jgi:hypothetical protein
MERRHNHWLFSKKTDLLVLFVPVWLCWLAAFLLPEAIRQMELPLWFWLVFILGIDVSHVWSTIFRTYLDREEFRLHRKILLLAPLLGFILCFLVAAWSEFIFWRVLAYVALFHFIKQQYGFMMIYRARQVRKTFKKFFADKWVIYLSMLYPVLYWHLNPGRHFNWFIDGDFITTQVLGWNTSAYQEFLMLFNPIANSLYWLILLGWLLEEIYLSRKGELNFSWGKTLWLLGTALNWYLGIVWFNSDLVFTLTNVVAHGVPYMALIFVYVNRKHGRIKPSKKFQLLSPAVWIVLMIAIVMTLAAGEEYFWDMLLYREREYFFQNIFKYPLQVLSHPIAQALAIALLSLPQVSHYIIDGFIWKGNQKNPYLKKIFE